MEGALDVERLHGAADALLRRHANLRGGIWHDGLERPIQVIAAEVELPWRQVDLSATDAELQSERRKQLLAADRAERFLLRKGPLLRFTLVRLGPRRHLLLLTNHHLVMDGWSLPVLLSELFCLYECGGDRAALPRTRPFADYLRWLAGQDREVSLPSCKQYIS